MCSKINILLCCTGSVATIKAVELVNLLQTISNVDIKVVLTEKAKHFCSIDDIRKVTELYLDEDEWKWKARSEPVLHIELSKWAHILLIAPLDANTLAKIAQGYCDNLLTCIARAWDLSKPLYFCPAMNTKMYTHPITPEHITKLKSWGYREIPCITKKLICGDYGQGAMEELDVIVKQIRNTIENMGN